MFFNVSLCQEFQPTVRPVNISMEPSTTCDDTYLHVDVQGGPAKTRERVTVVIKDLGLLTIAGVPWPKVMELIEASRPVVHEPIPLSAMMLGEGGLVLATCTEPKLSLRVWRIGKHGVQALSGGGSFSQLTAPVSSLLCAVDECGAGIYTRWPYEETVEVESAHLWQRWNDREMAVR